MYCEKIVNKIRGSSSVGTYFIIIILFRRTSSQRTLTSKTNLEETIVQPQVPRLLVEGQGAHPRA